jgi:hypothetical protein
VNVDPEVGLKVNRQFAAGGAWVLSGE